ncbi:MAG: hypothetical protein NVSMB62_15310 [Acidobacteriaceae bacterium]
MLTPLVCLAAALSLTSPIARAAEPDSPVRLASAAPDYAPTSFAPDATALPRLNSASAVELPDAPGFVGESSSSLADSEPPLRRTFREVAVLAEPTAFSYSPSPSSTRVIGLTDASGTPMTSRERDLACQSGHLHGKPCRASWGPILWEFLESTAIQNVGNIALDTETRNDLLTRPYWSTYAKCVHQFRYKQWRDDDNFMVDYVGHGIQGGIIASSFEQHSPTGRGLVYVNNGNYWRSRLKAMAWVTVYEVQWKIGPASEASIGNSGLNTYFTPRVKGRSTNETGFQDFVDTPIVGFWWNVGEDAVDRFIMPKIWRHTHNKWALSAYSVLTPCKATANILRFKPFYYRDFDLPPVGSAAVRN